MIFHLFVEVHDVVCILGSFGTFFCGTNFPLLNLLDRY